MVKSVIFDFNGVLADDEWVHMQAFQAVARSEGLPVTEQDYFESYLPLSDRDLFTKLFARGERPLEPDHLTSMVRGKAGHYYGILADEGRASGESILFPGAREAIDAAAGIGPVAIASGARREEIEFVLGKCGLLDRFHAIVAAEDVDMGKPDPEPYRKAAGLIGVAAADCIAIEDSIGGIESARRAGLRCLAVEHSYPRSSLGGADWVISRIDEFPSWLEATQTVP
jgi:beta-phosphoglucomutase-like phosphatase (HAD superfamily)